MSSHASHSPVPPERPHIRRPQTARSRFVPIQLLFPLLLLLSLSSTLLSNVPLASAHAAVTPLPTQKGTPQTFGQFLAQKAPARKPFVYPNQIPNRFAKEQAQNPAKVLPSTEPVKMQALHQTLSPAFLVNTRASTHRDHSACHNRNAHHERDTCRKWNRCREGNTCRDRNPCGDGHTHRQRDSASPAGQRRSAHGHHSARRAG